MERVYSYNPDFHKMHRFSDTDIRIRKMLWPWNAGQRSLKVVGTDTDWSATYDFLLTSSLMMSSAVWIESANVTDRQTDTGRQQRPPLIMSFKDEEW